MPHPRRIALLLWAGPAFFVLNVVWLQANSLLGSEPLQVRDTHPYLYSALMMPIGVTQVLFAVGVWFALRTLAGRNLPLAAIRYVPLERLRLRADELLPVAAAVTIASPALPYLLPHYFTTVDRLHLAQGPGIFSPWFIAWAVWSMPVSRFMKAVQVVVPVLMLLALYARGVAGADEGIVSVVLTVGFASGTVWLFATALWLASLMRRRAIEADSAAVGPRHANREAQ